MAGHPINGDSKAFGFPRQQGCLLFYVNKTINISRQIVFINFSTLKCLSFENDVLKLQPFSALIHVLLKLIKNYSFVHRSIYLPIQQYVSFYTSMSSHFPDEVNSPELLPCIKQFGLPVSDRCPVYTNDSRDCFPLVSVSKGCLCGCDYLTLTYKAKH